MSHKYVRNMMLQCYIMTLFFNCKRKGYMEIRVSKIPLCVCAGGGGRGWSRTISITWPVRLDFIQGRASCLF